MKVLTVEDSPEVVDTIELCVSMRWPHSSFVTVTDPAEAALTVENESPDLVLLDLALPGGDGLDVLQEIRNFSNVPVIIVSARSEEITRVRGLELGADDYIVKPFSHTELLARMKAVLRRVHQPELWSDEGLIESKRLTIDLARRQVWVDGGEVQLSPAEWNLLAFLARNDRKVVPHSVLAEQVWGSEFVEGSAMKMCVRRLRLKLGDDPRYPEMIRTVRGVGYRFELPR